METENELKVKIKVKQYTTPMPAVIQSSNSEPPAIYFSPSFSRCISAPKQRVKAAEPPHNLQ